MIETILELAWESFKVWCVVALLTWPVWGLALAIYFLSGCVESAPPPALFDFTKTRGYKVGYLDWNSCYVDCQMYSTYPMRCVENVCNH